MPSLVELKIDSYWAELMYTFEFLRKKNITMQDINVSKIPSNVSEQVLGHLIMLTVNGFLSLKTLRVDFVGPSEPDANLMRVAVIALSHSCLENIRFSLEGQTILEIGVSRMGPALQGLVMDASNIDDRGMLILADMLHRNKSNLKALCLGTFDCQDKARRDGVLSLLSQVLARPENCPEAGSALEYLSLVLQEMDRDGVSHLSKMVADSSLQKVKLFLDNQDIETKGISSLAQILKGNKSLQDFNLICNVLDDDFILDVAKELKHESLKNIKLQCTKSFFVSPRGYQALIDTLKVNTVLESVQLHGH